MPFRWDYREHWSLGTYFLKWLGLAVPIGAAVGSACALFLWALERSTQTRLDADAARRRRGSTFRFCFLACRSPEPLSARFMGVLAALPRAATICSSTPFTAMSAATAQRQRGRGAAPTTRVPSRETRNKACLPRLKPRFMRFQRRDCGVFEHQNSLFRGERCDPKNLLPQLREILWVAPLPSE